MEVTERKDMVAGTKVTFNTLFLSWIVVYVLISDLFLFQVTCLNNRTRRDTNKKNTATIKVTTS